MDKEKQIEEMANIPTKEEIEARNKRGKEKDELRQALLHYATAEASGGIKYLIDCEGCAFYLYEILGYRKLPKDSVVLSREEYEKLKMLEEGHITCEDVLEFVEKSSKETAEKFAKALKEMAYQSTDWSHGEHPMVVEVDYIDEVAEQFGVDIKE